MKQYSPWHWRIVLVFCAILILLVQVSHATDHIQATSYDIADIIPISLEYQPNKTSPIIPPQSDMWDSLMFSIDTTLLPRNTLFPITIEYSSSPNLNDTTSSWFNFPSVLSQFAEYAAISQFHTSSKNTANVLCGISSRLFYQTDGSRLMFQTGSKSVEGTQAIASCLLPISLFQIALHVLEQHSHFNTKTISPNDQIWLKLSLYHTASVDQSILHANEDIIATGILQDPISLPLDKWNVRTANTVFSPNLTAQTLETHTTIAAISPKEMTKVIIWNVQGYDMMQFFNLTSSSAYFTCSVPGQTNSSITVTPQFQPDQTIEFILPTVESYFLVCDWAFTIALKNLNSFTLHYSVDGENNRIAFVPSFRFNNAQFHRFDSNVLTWGLQLIPTTPTSLPDTFGSYFTGPFSSAIALVPHWNTEIRDISIDARPRCSIVQTHANGDPVDNPATLEIRSPNMPSNHQQPDLDLDFLYISSEEFSFSHRLDIRCNQAILPYDQPQFNESLLRVNIFDSSSLDASQTITAFSTDNTQFITPWPLISSHLDITVKIDVTVSTPLSIPSEPQSTTLQWLTQPVVLALQSATVPGESSFNVFTDIEPTDLIPFFGPGHGLTSMDYFRPECSSSQFSEWDAPQKLHLESDKPGAFVSFVIRSSFFKSFTPEQIAAIDTYQFLVLPAVYVSVSRVSSENSANILPVCRSALSSISRPDFSKPQLYFPVCSLGRGDSCFSSSQCPSDTYCYQNQCQSPLSRPDSWWDFHTSRRLAAGWENIDTQWFDSDASGVVSPITMSSSFVPVLSDFTATSETTYQGSISCQRGLCAALGTKQGIRFEFSHTDFIPTQQVELPARFSLYNPKNVSHIIPPIHFQLHFSSSTPEQGYATWVEPMNISFDTARYPFLLNADKLAYVLQVGRLEHPTTVNVSSSILTSPASITIEGFGAATCSRRTTHAFSTPSPLVTHSSLNDNFMQWFVGGTQPTMPNYNELTFTARYTHNNLIPLNETMTPSKRLYTGFFIYPIGLLHSLPDFAKAFSLQCVYQGLQLPAAILQRDVIDPLMWYYWIDTAQVQLTQSALSPVTLTCSWRLTTFTEPSVASSLLKIANAPTTGINIVYIVEQTRYALTFMTQSISSNSFPLNGTIASYVGLTPFASWVDPQPWVSLLSHQPYSRVLRSIVSSDKSFHHHDDTTALSIQQSQETTVSFYDFYFDMKDFIFSSSKHELLRPNSSEYQLSLDIQGIDAYIIENMTYSVHCELRQLPEDSPWYNNQVLQHGTFSFIESSQYQPNDTTTYPITFSHFIANEPFFIEQRSTLPNCVSLHLALQFTTLFNDSNITPFVINPTSVIVTISVGGQNAAQLPVDVQQMHQLTSDHVPSLPYTIAATPYHEVNESLNTFLPTLTSTSALMMAESPAQKTITSENLVSLTVTTNRRDLKNIAIVALQSSPNVYSFTFDLVFNQSGLTTNPKRLGFQLGQVDFAFVMTPSFIQDENPASQCEIYGTSHDGDQQNNWFSVLQIWGGRYLTIDNLPTFPLLSSIHFNCTNVYITTLPYIGQHDLVTTRQVTVGLWDDVSNLHLISSSTRFAPKPEISPTQRYLWVIILTAIGASIVFVVLIATIRRKLAQKKEQPSEDEQQQQQIIAFLSSSVPYHMINDD